MSHRASLRKFVSVAVLLVAGASLGAVTRLTGRVEAREIAVHSVPARAGEAAVKLYGNGATDLDCYVYDRLGVLVGFDNGPTDVCLVTIRQRREGEIRIEVENLGDVSNDYRLEVS